MPKRVLPSSNVRCRSGLAWSARSKEDLEQFAKALHLGVEGWQLGQRCRANCSGVRMLESGDAKSALNASQTRNTKSNPPFRCDRFQQPGHGRSMDQLPVRQPTASVIATEQFRERRIHAFASSVDSWVTDTPIRKEIRENCSELIHCCLGVNRLSRIGPKYRRNITNLDIGNLSHISDDGIH